MKRRTFIKSSVLISAMSIETFASPKTNSSAQLLSDFLKTFDTKSQHFLFAETSLKKSLRKSIQTSWKGFVPNQKKFYLIGQKPLCPIVLKNVNSETIDCAILCFEKIDNQWISLKSLSSFHLEGILKMSAEFSKNELADTFLPRFSNELLPYSFKTAKGEFYLKTNNQNGEFRTEIKVKYADNEAVTDSISSKLLC
jgi:hypothetical protein